MFHVFHIFRIKFQYHRSRKTAMVEHMYASTKTPQQLILGFAACCQHPTASFDLRQTVGLPYKPI